MKLCNLCHQTKPLEFFHKHKKNKDGLANACKECACARSRKWNSDNPDRLKKNNQEKYLKNKEKILENVRNYRLSNWDRVLERSRKYCATRRAIKAQAIPIWSESDKINVVYKKAKQYGFEVDHIVPIDNPLVCGLHCWHNLQLLETSVNRSKGNRYWPDMP